MQELIHKLGIDWKLLAAQVVNFLILLFVLKKFLYKPILELLAKRRKAIEDAAANAERIAQELAEIEARKAAEIDAAKREADTVLRASREAAKEREKEFMRATEEKVGKLIEDAKQRIEEERAKMLDEAGGDVRELVFMVAEKVLKGRVPAEADAEMVEEAIAEARRATSKIKM